MIIQALITKYKIYSTFLKINLQAEFQYRLDFFLYTIAALVSPLLGMGVWIAASSSGAKLQLNQSEILTYFALVLFVGTLNQTWHAWYIAEDITKGSFSKFLLRPFYLGDEYFLLNLTDKIFKISFTALLFTIGWIIFGIRLNGVFLDPQTVFLFIVSILFSFGIGFYLESIIGLATFWFHDIDFLKSLEGIVNQVLTGRLIPLVFFPAIFTNFLFLTPFRYLVSFPIEIITHKVSSISLIDGFITEIIWFLIMLGIYKYMCTKGSKKFEAYG